MGKNHNQNQTNTRLQEIALRNLVQARTHHQIFLIIEDPNASPRIEVHRLTRKQFLGQIIP